MAKSKRVKQSKMKKNIKNSIKRKKILDSNSEILKSIKNEFKVNS
jgi:hypothetical protein